MNNFNRVNNIHSTRLHPTHSFTVTRVLITCHNQSAHTNPLTLVLYCLVLLFLPGCYLTTYLHVLTFFNLSFLCIQSPDPVHQHQLIQSYKYKTVIHWNTSELLYWPYINLLSKLVSWPNQWPTQKGRRFQRVPAIVLSVFRNSAVAVHQWSCQDQMHNFPVIWMSLAVGTCYVGCRWTSY